MGSASGPGFLEKRRGGQPRFLSARGQPPYRAYAGIRQFRRHTVDLSVALTQRRFPIRRVAHGHELVRGLGLVGQGRPGKTVERPVAGVLREPGNDNLRQPVHAGRHSVEHRPLDWIGGDECRGQSCGNAAACPKFRGRVVECGGANGTMALLRRVAVFHGPAPLQRRISHLAPAIVWLPGLQDKPISLATA